MMYQPKPIELSWDSVSLESRQRQYKETMYAKLALVARGINDTTLPTRKTFGGYVSIAQDIYNRMTAGDGTFAECVEAIQVKRQVNGNLR